MPPRPQAPGVVVRVVVSCPNVGPCGSSVDVRSWRVRAGLSSTTTTAHATACERSCARACVDDCVSAAMCEMFASALGRLFVSMRVRVVVDMCRHADERVCA